MPTILFLNKAPPYRHTGAERVLWRLATHLADEEWTVHILCPAGRDPPDIENLSLHHVRTPESFFGEKAAFFLTAIPTFRRILTTHEIDLIYDNASPFPFLFAYLYGSQRVITKVHAIYRASALKNKTNILTKLGTPLGEQLYRLRDGADMLAVSESTKTRLAKLVRHNPDAITVVPNGIDSSAFDYQFNPDGPILALCELTPRKNIATLLEAWARLEAGVEPTRKLIIAGDGPRREYLEARASDLEIQSVEFLGYVSEDRKRELYREAYCYVLPTRMEGFGLTNLEAMASGCVVISTDSPGVNDYLTNRQNGYTVPTDDPNALTDQLREILTAPKTHEPIAEAGRDTAEQFAITTTVETEQKVLESMTDTEPAPKDHVSPGGE